MATKKEAGWLNFFQRKSKPVAAIENKTTTTPKQTGHQTVTVIESKATDLSEQTIRQYAKISKIPLKQVLDDLKNSGFSCNADDVLSKTMRQKLSKLFRPRNIAQAKSKAIKAIEAYAQIESEALTYAEAKATEALDKLLDKLKKIGQLIDLCFELLPETQRVSIMEEMNNQKMSEAYVQSHYNFLNMHFYVNKKLDLINKCAIRKYLTTDILREINQIESFPYPSHFFGEYNLGNIQRYVNEYINTGRFSEIVIIPQWIVYDYANEKFIKVLIKQNLYTRALIKTISFIINTDFSSVYLKNFEHLFFIGELFIDMGAINSALRLYDIDEGIFNNPNHLSLLTNNAIKIGNLESAFKLISKLIEKEPYHPSIPVMQSEIKRLEQRERLRSTFSIDFSKIDELSGLEFENLLMDKFAAMGFKVESTPKTGDFGADLIVENNEGTRIVVQCKRFRSKVNLKAVQEVIGAMGHYGGDVGVVITNNSFLNSAVKLAESHDIELWDGCKLASFLASDLSFSDIIDNSSK